MKMSTTTTKKKARKKYDLFIPWYHEAIELHEEKEVMELQLFSTIWKLIYTWISGEGLYMQDEKNNCSLYWKLKKN